MLEHLPVEILHRIFDYLDVQTLIFSLRSVCKRFFLIVNSYNRYDWNFQSLCKADLRSILRIIPISNVISITLSDEDRTRGQIHYFLSSCSLDKFIRLRSLTLLQIESKYLVEFLNFIPQSTLTHLHIDSRTFPPDRKDLMIVSLSAIISHPTLTHLQLNLSPDQSNHLIWPKNENLTSLRLVHPISHAQFTQILHSLKHLNSFSLKDIPQVDTDQLIIQQTYPQLRSLIFEDCSIDMEDIDRCLSLTPSIEYLKLIGQGTLFDSSFNGYQWESLIQKKLLRLKTFEFSFTILIYSNYRSRHMDLLMTPFRSPFWLRDMRCSIVCDYITNSRKILLYTVPICIKHFVYHTDSKKISLSNFTSTHPQNVMHNVTELELQLTKELTRSSTNKVRDE